MTDSPHAPTSVGFQKPCSVSGSELFRKAIIAHPYLDDDMRELQLKVWSPTPWMLDSYAEDEEQERIMWQWCRTQYGQECSVIHGNDGLWQRGNVTLHGWTWYGFHTEEAMDRFADQFPPPNATDS